MLAIFWRLSHKKLLWELHFKRCKCLMLFFQKQKVGQKSPVRSEGFGEKISEASLYSRRTNRGQDRRNRYCLQVSDGWCCSFSWSILATRSKNQKFSLIWTIWVFPKIGVPQNGWFIRENSLEMDDSGVYTHNFWKHLKFAHWCAKKLQSLISKSVEVTVDAFHGTRCLVASLLRDRDFFASGLDGSVKEAWWKDLGIPWKKCLGFPPKWMGYIINHNYIFMLSLDFWFLWYDDIWQEYVY